MHRDNSRRGEPPALTPEQEAILVLGNAIKRVGSFEAVLMRLSPPEEERFNLEIGSEMANAVATIKRLFINDLLVEVLLDDRRWTRVSDSPVKFKAELDRVFGAFARVWKKLHGLPDHRLSHNMERDRKIWRMHKSGKDFNQISTRFGLTRNAAELAYNRHDRRMERQTKLILDLCRTFLEESGFPGLKPVTDRVN